MSTECALGLFITFLVTAVQAQADKELECDIPADFPNVKIAYITEFFKTNETLLTAYRSDVKNKEFSCISYKIGEVGSNSFPVALSYSTSAGKQTTHYKGEFVTREYRNSQYDHRRTMAKLTADPKEGEATNADRGKDVILVASGFKRGECGVFFSCSRKDGEEKKYFELILKDALNTEANIREKHLICLQWYMELSGDVKVGEPLFDDSCRN